MSGWPLPLLLTTNNQSLAKNLPWRHKTIKILLRTLSDDGASAFRFYMVFKIVLINCYYCEPATINLQAAVLLLRKANKPKQGGICGNCKSSLFVFLASFHGRIQSGEVGDASSHQPFSIMLWMNKNFL